MQTPTAVLCSDNLWNTRLYPNHTITANEAASGNEAFRVGDARRAGDSFWTTTTATQDAWNKATCDRTRGADFFAIDRGHNLSGKTVRLQASQDDFTSVETVLDFVMPSASVFGALDDGVRTEEGAYLRRFPFRAARYWRLFVPAMGAGLRPKVVNLWVGLSYEPSRPFDLPWEEDADDLVMEELETDAGWFGRTRATPRRSGTLGLRLSSLLEYEQARLHVQAVYGSGRPMWIVFDVRQADRAVLALRPPQRFGFQFRPDWFEKRRTEIPWIEHEPKRL